MRNWSLRVALLGLVSLATCRGATQMVVEVSTDVPCAQHGGTSVAVGKASELQAKVAQPATLSTICQNDGRIGALVITPSAADDDEIAFQLTMGIGVDPTTACADASSASCIIARRSLRFLPNESLRIRVPLRASCAGRPCDPQSTCVSGACVPSAIADPSRCRGGGCGEETLASSGGAASDAGTPANVVDGSTPRGIELALGEDHTCALRPDGTVLCWGSNESGQLGNGESGPGKFLARPTIVTGLPAGIRALAVGANHSIALGPDGHVFVWGENFGAIPGGPSPATRPFELTGVPALSQVCGGLGHVCGLEPGGAVLWCWGTFVSAGADTPPASYPLDPPADSVQCGINAIVLKMRDATVWTAGDATKEAVGRPGAAHSPTPKIVAGLTGVTSTSMGMLDVVAITPSGPIAWGPNRLLELAVDEQRTFPTPTPAPQLAGFDPIQFGLFNGCGLKSGKAFCWGGNASGMLGVDPAGGVSRSALPRAIDGLPGTVNKLWTGQNHVCAGITDGSILCWGANELGQLGDGTRSPQPPHPVPVKVAFP